MQKSETHSEARPGASLDLDLRAPVRLDFWAITFAASVALSTILPPIAPVLVIASVIVSLGAVFSKDLVPKEWRLMAILVSLFVFGGVAVTLVHASASDPLEELASIEPGEVSVVGVVASRPVQSGFGHRADVRVESLWHEDEEILRGGGVEVFAPSLDGVGVGDRVRVRGEISLPDSAEIGFDYARYLGTNSLLLTDTSSPNTPLTSRSASGRTHTSSRSIL